MRQYLGPLNEKLMGPMETKGYNAWKNQRARCTRKNNKSYRDYGAKGIRVEYSSREFVGWFLDAVSKTGIPMDRLVVGRIDHDKSYSIGNIQLEEKSESIREMITRRGRRMPVRIYNRHGTLLAVAESQWAASRLTGITQGTISEQFKLRKMGINERTKRSEYRFEKGN